VSRNTLNTTETRREDWETPKWLFHFLNEVAGFNFAIDLAAGEKNSLCKKWICTSRNLLSMTREQLVQFASEAGVDIKNRWSWCNPPYGKNGLSKWTSTLTKNVPNVVALVPASVGTKWFRPLWGTASAVVLIGKRLKFGNSQHGAQFDSALYVRGDILTLAQMEQLRVLGVVIKANGVSPWRGETCWANAQNMR